MKLKIAAVLATAAIAGMMAGAGDAQAKRKKPAEAPAAGRTNIEDCAKVDAAQRDRCISLSRPVRGADLYAKWKSGGATAAAPAAPAAATKAADKVKAVAGAAAAAGAAAVTKAADKVKAVLPAGATSIDDCSKVDASVRDACISRSKPVSGADLYKKYKN